MTAVTGVTIPSRFRWRVIDIVVASVIGVASGLVFFAWNQLFTPATAPLEAALPGAQALLYGVWLFAGVLGGLIIRKPGAALFVEAVAAAVSMVLGSIWAFDTLMSGLFQGFAAEIVFAAFLYSNWRIYVAVIAGAASGLAMGIKDNIVWNAAATAQFQLTYLICGVISGAVIAGAGSWLLARGLARTGALSRFAAGREVTARV
jgi:energy-coupling factor transport system substrate-specific component